MSPDNSDLFGAALSLPQSERADLAFQLLQSLDQPGHEIDSDIFGDRLRARVESYRLGEIDNRSLNEARVIIERQLSQGRGKQPKPRNIPLSPARSLFPFRSAPCLLPPSAAFHVARDPVAIMPFRQLPGAIFHVAFRQRPLLSGIMSADN